MACLFISGNISQIHPVWKAEMKTLFIVQLVLALAFTAGAETSSYDPLAVSADAAPKIVDLTVHDAARDRDIPLRVYLPTNTAPVPVILFSHGLGGNREGSKFMGEHWAARGYVAVFLQHPGSDDSVWKGKPPGELMPDLERAASLENFLLRVQDVPAVLNQLEIWNVDNELSARGPDEFEEGRDVRPFVRRDHDRGGERRIAGRSPDSNSPTRASRRRLRSVPVRPRPAARRRRLAR